MVHLCHWSFLVVSYYTCNQILCILINHIYLLLTIHAPVFYLYIYLFKEYHLYYKKRIQAAVNIFIILEEETLKNEMVYILTFWHIFLFIWCILDKHCFYHILTGCLVSKSEGNLKTIVKIV